MNVPRIYGVINKPVKTYEDINLTATIKRRWGNTGIFPGPDNEKYADNMSTYKSIKHLDRIDLSGRNIYSFGELPDSGFAPVTDLDFALTYMKSSVDKHPFNDNISLIRMKVYNQSASGEIPSDIIGLSIENDIDAIRAKVEKTAIVRYIDFSPDMTEVYTETVMFEGNNSADNTPFVFDFGLLFDNGDKVMCGNNFIST